MKDKVFAATLKVGTFISLLATTGCAEYHKRVLHHTDERGTEFTKALAQEYEGLGTTEEKIMYDERSADYYFRKAILAKEGQCVGPTMLEKWDIDAEKMPELIEAQARFLWAVESGAREVAPKMTAHAQAHFDCWVEQQSEGWQKEDIALCRSEFYTAMADVEFMLQGGYKITPPESILFDFNSFHLTVAAQHIVDSIAQKIHLSKSNQHILLVGYTDKIGDLKHNKELAYNRAMAVKKELVQRGVPDHLVAIKAMGEAAGPEVDKHNRRVDIIFLRHK